MSLKKLDTWLIVKTAVVWMAIVSIVCTIAFLLVPAKTLEILWKPMFHNVVGLEQKSLLIVGFVEALSYTAVLVWLFVTIYNQFAGKR